MNWWDFLIGFSVAVLTGAAVTVFLFILSTHIARKDFGDDH